MAGRVHRLIQRLYEVRGVEPSSLHFLRAHLVMSGINPDEHTATSRDDERKVQLLEKMLADFQAGASESKNPGRNDTGSP